MNTPPFAIGEPVAFIRSDGTRILGASVTSQFQYGQSWHVTAKSHDKTFTGDSRAFESMIGVEILRKVKR